MYCAGMALYKGFRVRSALATATAPCGQTAKRLQDTLQRIEHDLQMAERNIDTHESRIKKDFSKGAVRFFMQPLIERALEVMANAKQDSEGIPDMRQTAIDYILARNWCICGCDL